VTDVVLFHHIQGLTPGVVAFADRLRAAGHTVHTPDLLEGRTFPTIEEGEAHVRALGFDTVFARGVAAAEALPAEAAYAGISLGVGPAQQLAQNRPGARGALILAAFMDPSEFGSWPEGLPVQIHGMDADPFFAGEGDIDAARTFVEQTKDAELFVYPGDGHLFMDSSVDGYDEEAATLLTERVLAFLDRVQAAGPTMPTTAITRGRS
jgi:dienelactone hydrolase